MWDNINDCDNQLSDTIVRLKEGEPVMIMGVSGNDRDIIASYLLLKDMAEGACKVEDLDLSPVPLGYVNAHGRSYYCVRQPRRRWKHGLDNGSLKTINSPNRFRADGETYPALASTIKRDYPTMEEGMEYLKIVLNI